MFRFLTQRTNIFSIPIYIGILFAIIFFSSTFSLKNIFFSSIAFLSLSLGFFLIKIIDITKNTHIPFFIYTFYIFTFYNYGIDIEISLIILIKYIILFLLISYDKTINKNHFVLMGNLLALGYIFFPQFWIFFIFIIAHILFTSNRVFFNIFQLIFGILIVILGWFCLTYILNQDIVFSDYIPFINNNFVSDFSQLYPLIPSGIIVIMSIMEHLFNYNKKNPTDRFRYSFLMLFLLIEVSILVLYMGDNYDYFFITILPVCIIMSRFLIFLKYNWLKEIIIFTIIISSLLFKFNYIFNLL